MADNIYLASKPTKGVAYTFYFNIARDASAPTWEVGISKDGGTFVATTNSPVAVNKGSLSNATTAGHYSLTLTATEMNADFIMVAFKATGISGSLDPTIIIYTLDSSATLGVVNFTGSFLNFLVSATDAGFGLIKVDLGESGFNYYGFRKTSNSWIMVKENISTFALTYAVRNDTNHKEFDQAWISVTSLTYSSSQTLI